MLSDLVVVVSGIALTSLAWSLGLRLGFDLSCRACPRLSASTQSLRIVYRHLAQAQFVISPWAIFRMRLGKLRPLRCAFPHCFAVIPLQLPIHPLGGMLRPLRCADRWCQALLLTTAVVYLRRPCYTSMRSASRSKALTLPA